MSFLLAGPRAPFSWAAALLGAALSIAGGSAAARDAGAPATPQHDAVDTYFDTRVTDPYRWLEDGADPKVRQWSQAQDARTRHYLDALPVRKAAYARMFAQLSETSPYYYGLKTAGGRIFAYNSHPPKQQPMIATMSLQADPATARVVLDPNARNPKGTTAIDWFEPSPDGRLVAASLSEDGSEDGTLHVFEARDGRELADIIPRVQYPTGGGSLAWSDDSKGFWYTRYPGRERPAAEQHFFQKVYFHRLGQDPATDLLVLGDGLPKVAEISLQSGRYPGTLLVTVANGDGGEFAHYLVNAAGTVTQITRFEDAVSFATVAGDGSIYMVSHRDAPRGKLLKMTRADPVLAHAVTIVGQSDAAFESSTEGAGDPVVVTGKLIYVRQIAGGPSRVPIFDLDGHPRGELPSASPSTVSEVIPLADGTVLYDVATYLRPTYYARYDPARGVSVETRLAQKSPVSFDDAEVVREFATSPDGTRVPLNIVRRKGTALDGSNPLLLNGYGGYGVNLTPAFLGPRTRLWLDGGGVYVIANLRGGGEFGQSWHLQGNLTHKQNVFEDFIASARYLVERKYTAPGRLAIIGGSNGGLLMGAAFTQHPELFRAVASLVGVYDMLRAELDPNGLFNTTEYGTVKEQDQFRALYAYSPYHHVADGTKYPAIFMATGATDGRVNPAHSRKMIARLQAATSGGPVYLSSSEHAGHGMGSALSIRVGQWADQYAFLFDQLGMTLPARSGQN